MVGMSGGVDSSVSALLLKKAGHDVAGGFIKVWQPEFVNCDWRAEREDAMRVAAMLGIPFETFDFEAEYKREVAEEMFREYSFGRTPNPDVLCNRHIKFGAFAKAAKEKGFDAVATGHYARIVERGGLSHLYAGADKNKDQSYFLWMLGQKDLKRAIFPNGDLQKSQVRKIAERAGLPTAAKKDSQGLCFVGKFDMKDFLARFLPKKIGEVLDEKNNVIGHHDGAHLYTIGARRGFTITKKTTHDAPRYVVATDVEKNTVTVSFDKEPTKGGSTKLQLCSINWIAENPSPNKKYGARYRYRQPLINATIKVEPSTHALQGSTLIELAESRRIPIGQSLVVYSGEECLGGGIIEEVLQ